MSFARQNPGRPLFSQAQIVSARERALLAENQLLRNRNKRLKEAMLTLVERIEMQLPYLKESEASASRAKAAEDAKPRREEDAFRAREKTYRTRGHTSSRAQDEAFRERARRYRRPTPKMEVYETFEEPITFGEPAPEMHLGSDTGAAHHHAGNAAYAAARDYHISPDLAPEEIDILKSPTHERIRRRPPSRETVEVVDLHPAQHADAGAERYEPGEMLASDIPAFTFAEDEPVVDIEFERKESLRAAMRHRANRLRW